MARLATGYVLLQTTRAEMESTKLELWLSPDTYGWRDPAVASFDRDVMVLGPSQLDVYAADGVTVYSNHDYSLYSPGGQMAAYGWYNHRNGAWEVSVDWDVVNRAKALRHVDAAARPAPEPVANPVNLELNGETYTNEFGGKQTKLPHRLDLLPAAAVISVGRVLMKGSKYGENNWHKTTVAENINHAQGHVMAFLHGDKSEPHLAHAATRILFALWLQIRDTGKLDV